MYRSFEQSRGSPVTVMLMLKDFLEEPLVLV